MTGTMKAMVTMGHGGMDQMVWHEAWPRPAPGPGEVLIRVGACGLNNTDVNTRAGWYAKEVRGPTTSDPAPELHGDGTWGASGLGFPRIQGADVCGVVEAVGEGADAALIGRRVITDNWVRDPAAPMDMDRARYFGSEMDGGFAEYTVIPARNVAAVDSALSDAELATFSCSYTTAEGMLTRAGVDAGDVVLVTGASGGVGSALVPLAKRRGAVVVGMASEDKHAALAPLGADALLPRAPGDLRAALRQAIGRDSVTVVADIVGGPGFPQVIEALARGGRYTCSGAIAGPIVELDLRTFYLNDLTFTGSTIVPPHVFGDVVGYIERGEIRPLLAATWPLRELHAAQTAFLEKHHVGKIAVLP